MDNECVVGNPYGEWIDVVKNDKGKTFALIGILTETDIKSIRKNCDVNVPMEIGDVSITLKCPPGLAVVLSEKYSALIPGYYSNKVHWNTIIMDKDVPLDEVQ